ncbi:MAG TPA: chloride channel protein, partial [Thermoleophilaceae bacterium]
MRLLVLAALVGVPISAVAYGFLELAHHLNDLLFTDLPDGLGFDTVPTWWPLPLLALGGLLTALAIRDLPGIGGHRPAEGFHAAGVLPPIELPGVVAAALATLSFGVVLGPEAPLIAIGSGLGFLAFQQATRGSAPNERAGAVMAATGSFAAISSLVGSPLLGAFLLLEAAGLGGVMATVVLLPGFLAAGIGTLIFLGLNDVTGLGVPSLTIPGLPAFGDPTIAMFAWAIVFGLVAPFLGEGLRWIALTLQPHVERRMVLLMPILGLAMACLAILFGEATDHDQSDVLFSGQDALGPLILHAADYSVGALLLLVLCKGLAYALALSSFRGGPIFPALFVGAAAGIAASHLPGLEVVPAAAMGMGAMSAVMLGLPLSSVLLATVLLGKNGTDAIPLV